jgi:8-oxo-dGTP pyrophosphatase MutT (NUDIX family)
MFLVENDPLHNQTQTLAMNAPSVSLACSSVAELRTLCATRLESAPSPRVFDNRLEPPRSDYDLEPGRASGGLVKPRASAVLVPIVARPKGLSVILIQRPETMAAHAGQISFPGGKVDEKDSSPVETALREAEEEIGLARTHVEVLGFLDCYQVGSGFRIVPVVGLVTPPFTLSVDTHEVIEAFEVPLAFLMDPGNHEKRSREMRGTTQWFYAMPYQDRFIWGATANMIRNLFERLTV